MLKLCTVPIAPVVSGACGWSLEPHRSGLDLLDKVSKFKLVENVMVDGRTVSGTVKSSIREGNAELRLQQKGYWVPIYRGTDPVKMWTNHYIGTAIHELTHLPGSIFSDGRLAQAAFDLGFSKTKIANPDSNNRNEIDTHSSTWQSTLEKYCGGN